MVKEPVPGRVKTRLCPPCRPDEAAQIAEAAIIDTLAAACASRASEVVVALDGAPGPWLPGGVRVVPQCDGGLADRLTAAWSETRGPGIQIGMDTPQLTPADLDRAMDGLAADPGGAVLGPARDGGWWLIGMHGSTPGAFDDVPMSSAETGARQLERLEALGLRTVLLEQRTDVDHFDDAVEVAGQIPHSRFAAAVEAVRTRIASEAR